MNKLVVLFYYMIITINMPFKYFKLVFAGYNKRKIKSVTQFSCRI